MIIEKVENKIKLAALISGTSIVCSLILCVVVFFGALNMVQSERNQIYVLNGEIPLVAEHTEQALNLDIEAKAHVNRFHDLFFTLPPDDDYIKYTLEKAMYLVDESGLKQRNALQEKGFYSGILSQSAAFSIMCDSISFQKETMHFVYFGTQRIERKTSILKRQIITEGDLQRIPRTNNNPHGLLIVNYKTVLNRDLEYIPKSDL